MMDVGVTYTLWESIIDVRFSKGFAVIICGLFLMSVAVV